MQNLDSPNNSVLFSVLRRGLEKKLGRGLTTEELQDIERQAIAAGAKQVKMATSTPRETVARMVGHHEVPQNPTTSAQQAVLDFPEKIKQELLRRSHAAQQIKKTPARERRYNRKKVNRGLDDVVVLIQRARADGRIGPQLPAYARKTSALYVQQDDLEDIIPDGWGNLFSIEAKRIGKHEGLPPAAIPLLCLLEWASSFQPSIRNDKQMCGAGFQVSLDWLARKMGCSRVWIQSLINKLDPYAQWRRDCLETKRENRRRVRAGKELLPRPVKPTGVAYIQRFRRLVKYEDTCEEAARRRVWIDRNGKHHWYADVRGVCYLTSAGRGIVGRKGAPLDASADVHNGGFRSRWFISARLRRGNNLLGGHLKEVFENRVELRAAPDIPENLSPNHFKTTTRQT